MIKAILHHPVRFIQQRVKWFFVFGLVLLFVNCYAQQKLYSIRSTNTGEIIQKANTDSIKWVETLNERQERDQDKGYLLAGTDSISKGDTLVAWYFKGQRFYWLKLQVDSVSQSIFSQFNLKQIELKLFRIKQWAKIKQRVIYYCRENGYPNALIKLQNIAVIHDSIAATVYLQLGAFVRFGDLIVQGDTVLSNRILARHIGFKQNLPYSDDIAKNIDQRLNELPYLQVAQSSEIYRINNRANAYLFLKRKSANQFSGIIGLANSSKNKSKLLLTGELNLNLINALKKGEELSIEWQKLQEQTQELKTHFVFPYIMGSAIGLDASFMLYKHDTTYLTTNPNIGVRYQTKGSSYIRAFMDYKTSNVLLQQTIDEEVGSITQFLYGAEYYAVDLDNRYNPYKGYKLNASASTGSRTLKPLDKLDNTTEKRQQYKIDAEIYIPLAPQLTFKLRNYSAYLSGSKHVVNEMFRLGGVSNLRGIEENSLRVSAFSVQTAEIRLIFESASALFLFFDGAWYEQRLTKGYYSDKPIGLGAGMQFTTKAGVFSLQYAVGEQRGTTLSFSQAKIHIGYINRF